MNYSASLERSVLAHSAVVLVNIFKRMCGLHFRRVHGQRVRVLVLFVSACPEARFASANAHMARGIVIIVLRGSSRDTRKL